MKNITYTIMKTLIITFLLASTICNAQAPSDFLHVYDSITFVADPASGNSAKQITLTTGKLPVVVPAPNGFFKIGLYTANNSGPISNYLHFSGFMTDSIDTSKNPVVNIQITPANYLAKVAVKDMPAQKRPILRLYAGSTQSTQQTFFTQGEWYYVYLRRTATNQVFRIDYDGSGDISKMATFEPVPGKVGQFAPLNYTITANVIDPF